MKANEAPEKIYLIEGEPILSARSKKTEDANIEYTRTDVFIERVCDWLSDTLQTVVDANIPSAHHVESIPVLGIITQTEYIEKFRKEIKYLFD